MSHRPEDLPDPREIAERVRELDERLDACFLAEIAGALERSRRARIGQAL
jgi:hypothetical protein